MKNTLPSITNDPSHDLRSVPSWNPGELKPRTARYAVLIPVINEGERLLTQLERMKPYLPLVDVLIVDGGSSDGSTDRPTLQKLGVTACLTKANGKSSFCDDLRIGFAFALQGGYEGVVLMDGNNKDNPEALRRFCAHLDQGYDLVQGSRFLPGGKAENTPFIRTLSIRMVHAPFISWAAGFRYTDSTNGFRAFSRRLLTDVRVRPLRDVFSAYDLPYYLAVRAARLDLRVIEIPVERAYPKTGPTPTKITPIRGNLRMLGTLLRVSLRRLDPPGGDRLLAPAEVIEPVRRAGSR